MTRRWGHRPCRQMIEDTIRERDEACAEARHWRRMYDQQQPAYDAKFAELEQSRKDIVKITDDHVEILRKAIDEREETIRGLLVELAMVREGLAP